MKTIQDYELRCTEEQTRRAYKLGAPIRKETTTNYSAASYNGYIILTNVREFVDDTPIFTMIKIPTTQQIIGWLISKGFIDLPCKIAKRYEILCERGLVKRLHQAELSAIDAALDYLEKKGGTK